MDISTKIKLNNDLEIPALGFGTYQLTEEETVKAILTALKKGYIHVDTAAIYENEKKVGEGIKESGIAREELFVTTKLWNDDHDDVEGALSSSLNNLGIGYVDLYLMHWPTKKRIESWKAMEKLFKDGKCKAIGVSNFTVDHLKELMEKTDVVPAVNQVEFSPYLYQKELLEFCKEKGIVLEAYSPLTRGHKLNDPKLIEIAEKYGKSAAKILIRWGLQKGIVVLPKSKMERRVMENANVFDFEISEEDMQKLDSFNEDLHTCWNPYTEAEKYG